MQKLVNVRITKRFDERGVLRQPGRVFQVAPEKARAWMARHVAEIIGGQFSHDGPNEVKKLYPARPDFRSAHIQK